MTKKELEKLKEYIKANGSLSNNFGSYSKLYSMTTENIYGFLNRFDLKNKRVLTVAGSGDQILNCYSLGADEVISFDINPLCDLQARLKMDAVRCLGYTDFISFFGIISDNNKSFFDPKVFDKFKYSLDNDVYDLFNYIINEYDRNPQRSIYFEFDNTLKLMKKLNHYINPNNYRELSYILDTKKSDFLNVNVDNLPEVLDGEKFDLILLSNISDYIHYVYYDNSIERFKELIDKLTDNLNLYGTIQIGYIYSRYYREEDVSRFRFNKTRNEVFPNYIYHSNFVDSYYNDGTYDKIITYQKLK